MENVDQLFAVEESAQQQTEQPEVKEESQDTTLDILKKTSVDDGGYTLENGKVVFKTATTKEAAPKEEGTPAEQPDEPVHELTWNGQKITKKQSETIALAQQGLDYTKKMQAMAEERRQVEQMAAVALEILQKQQPTGTAENDDDPVNAAMAAVKEKFGKDDPDFEFDPLDPKQQAHFALTLVKYDKENSLKSEQQVQMQKAVEQQAIKLTSWEEQQRHVDPEYDAVIGWATQNVGTAEKPVPKMKQILSAEQFAAADEAYRSGDTGTLSKVLNYIKKKYQSETLGVSTRPTVQPPTVQRAGNTSVQPPVKATRDAKELAKLDPDQRVAWLKENLTKRRS